MHSTGYIFIFYYNSVEYQVRPEHLFLFVIEMCASDPSLVPVEQLNWAASDASRDICYGPLTLWLTQPYHINYW
jgi:hypothetical protein